MYFSLKYRVVVLALALAITALPAFAAGEEDTGGAAADASGPQYGGTLTLGYADLDPPTADVVEGRWPTTKYTSFVLDYLLTADIDKFGPRGQNAHAFTAPLSVPEEYTRGGVIEDWEITPNKLIFRIRPGVQWAAIGKEHVMESRELVAEDIVFSLMRFWTAPAMGWLETNEFPDWLVGMYAEDQYTFVVEFKYFNAVWRGAPRFRMGQRPVRPGGGRGGRPTTGPTWSAPVRSWSSSTCRDRPWCTRRTRSSTTPP